MPVIAAADCLDEKASVELICVDFGDPVVVQVQQGFRDVDVSLRPFAGSDRIHRDNLNTPCRLVVAQHCYLPVSKTGV